MLSRLLVVGVLAGAGLGGLLGQTGSVPFDWASLVGGAVGSSPAAVVLAWRLSKADKEAATLREELRDMHGKNVALVERTITVLSKATDTLDEVRSGMEATMNRARPGEMDQTLRRLEELASDIARSRREQR